MYISLWIIPHILKITKLNKKTPPSKGML